MEKNKPKVYHINEECVDIKVGILFCVADDTGLHHTTTTLNLQAGRCHAGQLEALQVAQPPCQDLKSHILKVIFFCVGCWVICSLNPYWYLCWSVLCACIGPTSIAVRSRTGLMPCGTMKTFGSLWGGRYGKSESSGYQSEHKNRA